jgi:hypothetical protein
MSQPQPTPAPAIIPDGAPAATDVPQSLTRRLDAGEEFWVWKMGLRAFLIVAAIIGIGCMGWALSTAPVGPYSYGPSSTFIYPLITYGVSAVWCAVCILVLLLRRPNRPVHPGVAVALDLILWLAFVPTTLFAVLCAIDVLDYGVYNNIGSYSVYGSYEQAANGTWVWEQTDYDSHYGRTRECDMANYDRSGSYHNFPGYGFNSCAEEDAYVNALWSAKGNRARVIITGVGCQGIGLLLHIALFIWACVDTNRRNRREVGKDAEKMATDIVMNMIRTGAVVRAQNQHGMQQPLLQQPQRPPHAWIPGPVGPPPVVLGPEKGESARFA